MEDAVVDITTVEFDTAVSQFAAHFGWAIVPVEERAARVGSYFISVLGDQYSAFGQECIGLGSTIRLAVEDLIQSVGAYQQQKLEDRLEWEQLEKEREDEEEYRLLLDSPDNDSSIPDEREYQEY